MVLLEETLAGITLFRQPSVAAMTMCLLFLSLETRLRHLILCRKASMSLGNVESNVGLSGFRVKVCTMVVHRGLLKWKVQFIGLKILVHFYCSSFINFQLLHISHIVFCCITSHLHSAEIFFFSSNLYWFVHKNICFPGWWRHGLSSSASDWFTLIFLTKLTTHVSWLSQRRSTWFFFGPSPHILRQNRIRWELRSS